MDIELFHSTTTKGIACCKKRVASIRFQVICNLVVIGYNGQRFVTYICMIYVKILSIVGVIKQITTYSY